MPLILSTTHHSLFTTHYSPLTTHHSLPLFMLQIENAKPHHLPAIVEIYNEAIREGFSTADTETFTIDEKQFWFNEHDHLHPIFVVLLNDEVCGWLSLSAYRPGRKALSAVREVSYYVHANFRKKGVATALLHHAENFCEQNNLQHLIAIVLGKNVKTISFLEKQGFDKWGTLPGIADFNGESVDHLYFGKHLLH